MRSYQEEKVHASTKLVIPGLVPVLMRCTVGVGGQRHKCKQYEMYSVKGD